MKIIISGGNLNQIYCSKRETRLSVATQIPNARRESQLGKLTTTLLAVRFQSKLINLINHHPRSVVTLIIHHHLSVLTLITFRFGNVICLPSFSFLQQPPRLSLISRSRDRTSKLIKFHHKNHNKFSLFIN
jgi:hypothetical protein